MSRIRPPSPANSENRGRTNDAPPIDGESRIGRARVALQVLLAAAFTTLVIQYSFSQGKLAVPPFYDDVAYFEDALHRLAGFYRGGMARVVSEYVKSPPHSPFSSLVATAAFAILGVHDWAPYAFNGLIVLGLLAYLDATAGRVPITRKIGLFLFALCMPVTFEAVYEFRPDVAWGLCCAIGIMLLLRRSILHASRRYRLAAGAMFGLALLFKPPTSPLTLILLAVSLATAFLPEPARDRRRVGVAVIAAGSILIAAFVIPLPHYLLTARETWAYIKAPIFGSTRDIWKSGGTAAWQLEYYLTGGGGRLMLGRELPVLAAVIGAGLAALLTRRRFQDAARVAAMLWIALVAYVVTVLLPVKQPFFGTAMDWILVLCALHVLTLLARFPGRTAAATLWVVTVVALLSARFENRLFDPGSPEILARNRLTEDIYHAIRADPFQPWTRVYITTTGYINAGVLDYLYRRDTLEPLNIGENSYSDDLRLHEHAIGLADEVIASEPDNGNAFADFIRSGLVQDRTLALVRHDPDFTQAAVFSTLNGRHYYLFRRVIPFCGWVDPSGMTRIGYGTSAVWRGNAPRSVLFIPPEGPSQLRLVVLAQTIGRADVAMTVFVDGRRSGRRVVAAGAPHRFTLPLRIHGGGRHTVELRYSAHDAVSGRPALEFRQLEIIPDSN